MRVISGQFKNRILKMPADRNIRPTRDLVKKGVFDVLATLCPGYSQALDLFSASGSLGIEAISRGAERVFFVEDNPACIRVLRENITRLGLVSRSEVLKKDALTAIKGFYDRKLLFDLILLDPPYYQGLAKKCLICLDEYVILPTRGVIAAEHYKKDDLPETLRNITLYKKKSYGDTVVSFFLVNAEKVPTLASRRSRGLAPRQPERIHNRSHRPPNSSLRSSDKSVESFARL